ncbi:phosphoethanolamine transferase [Helicobacter sp. UBA3407]|uniref:phosphoethanolamine transferase n=2 Tax=Helicobacter TaxID=209 RepID=UPI0025D4D2A6|nr:phosphoethanolamine transferase [Helicobacter sp. UBA3407]
MKLLDNLTLLRICIILILLNTIILLGSQYYVYTKHWDLYWFSSFFYRELLLCVSYFCIFWILSLLPHSLGKTIAWIIFSISLVCFIIDVFLLYTFDTNLNSYLVIVALETNPQESAEFLHNYVSVGLCVLYVCFTLVCAVLWRCIKPIQQTRRRIKGILIWLIVSIGILLSMALTHTKPLNEDWHDMLYNYTRQIYRALHSTYTFMEEYKTLNAKFESLSAQLQVKKAKNHIENIVLVIGESTQRNKLSLYGYPLPTTPLLNTLKTNNPKNLLIFNDVISPHAQTHESLSLSLTLANQDSQGIPTTNTKAKQTIKPWYESLNIIDAFKLGGYHTFSISNQEPVSLFGNAAASILKRANEVEFVNINDKMSTTKFDESILELLDESLKQPAYADSKQHFYALHLMGNHAKYYNRYPLEFAHFTQQDMLCTQHNSGDSISGGSIEENMHYDNATLYGDFILSEIIKRFATSDSLVLYFSDHGEEVYDFRNFIGHSDSKISRFMVEIPFIIYVSDTFIQKHPALYKRLQKAQNQRYMSDDLIHTLLDIAGITLKGYEPQRSIISSNKTFLNKRARKVGAKDNVKDYDKDLKSQQSYIEQGLCRQ